MAPIPPETHWKQLLDDSKAKADEAKHEADKAEVDFDDDLDANLRKLNRQAAG